MIIRKSYILLPAVFFFMLLTVVEARKLQDMQQAVFQAKDTTIKNDSLTPQDPKEGFKSLFVHTDLGSGISSEQLNQQAKIFVQDYLNKNGKWLNDMKEWGKPYFNMMDAILEQHGIPKEMKYLAVIESGLKKNAVSWAGAVGPWAFMPATAKNYGLRVSKYQDDRVDYYKSTHAAARMLTELYQTYGDWLLVIAAYNGGPGNVNKAIRNSGSRDFWQLQYHLPNESMNHVKKFIATHYIMEGEGGVTTATKNELSNLVSTVTLNEDEMNSSTAYNITGRFNAAVIIKHTGVDAGVFNKYNPGFDNQIALNGKYELRLPTVNMNLFVTKRYQILDESMALLMNSTSAR